MAQDHVWRRCDGSVAGAWSTTFAFFPLIAVMLTGCGGKSAVSQLRDGTPTGAAARAMTLYDGDLDAKLSATELAAAPGLVDGLSRIDSNRDGVVDLAEMTARITT